MSRRRIEAGFNSASSSFSLKEVNSSSHVADTLPPQSGSISFQIPNNTNLKREQTIPFPMTQSTELPSGLSFKLNNLCRKPVEQDNGEKKKACEHAFGMPINMTNKSSNIAINPEVMRLSAQKDDLRGRLRASSEKNLVLESQLQRLQKAALKERTDFAKQLSLARSEMKVMKEAEVKLKHQVAEFNASFEKRVSFETAIKSAMNTKELAEKQATLNELSQETKNVQAQLEQLQKIRDVVVEETRAHEAQKEKHVDLTKSIQEMEASIQTQESKLFDVSEEFAKTSSELKLKSDKVEEITSLIQERTNEFEAAKAEHKRLSDDSARINEEINLMKTRTIFVRGDEAPTGTLLCTPLDSMCKRVDDMSSSSSGIPNHFEHDAPISLTGHSTQMVNAANEGDEHDNNTEAMLAAIVGDLKQFLAQASVENENRGLDRGAQTGIVVSCAA